MKKIAYITLLLVLCMTVFEIWIALGEGDLSPVTPATEPVTAPLTDDPLTDVPVTEPVTAPETEPISEQPSSSPARSPELSSNAVEFYGRFLQVKSGYRFDWSGSAIEAGFVGTSVELSLALVEGTVDYFNVYLDGGAATMLTVTNKKTVYPLATGLKEGYHSVRIEKRTEGKKGALCEFRGFSFPDGRADKAPARPARFIEIYGDSLAAGHGVEGEFGNPDFYLDEENVAVAFGKTTADLLGASYSVIARSGYGVAGNYAGDTRYSIPGVYRRVMFHSDKEMYDFSVEPDVVIVELGSNDVKAKYSVAKQQAAYEKFFRALREKYPHTAIVAFTGGVSWGQYEPIEGAVATLNAEGDANVYSLLCVYPDGIEIGSREVTAGLDHPNEKGNTLTAQQLADFIRKIKNW